MKVRQLNLKVFAETDTLNDDDLIPVFHKWIQERRLPKKLCIDVVDYKHVVDGPGVMLVAQEAHYGLDRAGGSLGLLYARKRDALGDAQAKLKEAFKDALFACAALQEEPALSGTLQFGTSRFEVSVQDRLHCPHTEACFQALRAELETFLATWIPGVSAEISAGPDSRGPLLAKVELKQGGALKDLLARL